MKRFRTPVTALIGFALCFSSIPSLAGELWKGHTTVRPLEVGLLSGFSIYGDQANWGVLPAVAKLIKEKGFAEDIDNRVWIEGQLGPTFFSNHGVSKTGMQYSAHLRWDFMLNADWTFYALGGLGGNKASSELGGDFQLLPRFGAGAVLDIERQTHVPIGIRGELSRELISVGVQFRI
ncbi:MAG: hypothetical protein EBX52_08535 [Proteobacteria bacterium]|nr:hypothetical protein [Pseudomonadota bacterium]